MRRMFYMAHSFNHDLSKWDVSNVTNMSAMFCRARTFNQDLNGWSDKLTNVTDMNHMFSYAHNFDQDLSKWDVSSVTDMSHMFMDAKHFNQDLSEWSDKLKVVQDVSYMFFGANSLRDTFEKSIKETWKLPDDCNKTRMWVSEE